MATLALAVAGAAVGSALLPAGLTVLGATITGATLGAQIGALAGSFIDKSLLGASGHPTLPHGPRLSDLRVTASSEGATIPRLYGHARLGGQVIWATNLEEEVVQSGSSSGGGKGGSSQSQASPGIEYRYFANFAVALAEGPISGLGRVWADGQELDLSTVAYRLYTGSEDQLPDSLIEAKEGAGNAPAYRGVAYIVFERMDLDPLPAAPTSRFDRASKIRVAARSRQPHLRLRAGAPRRRQPRRHPERRRGARRHDGRRRCGPRSRGRR
jgi:hypothetical protein